MIAAISPSDFNYDETLSTLRYAARAKSIKNKPRINEDPKDALLKQYEEEIKKLKELLQSGNGNAINIGQENFGLMRRPTQEHLVMGGDETVDQLLEKLARKGKKVKILDESMDDEDGPGTNRNKHYQNSIQEEEHEDDEVNFEDGIREDI